MRRDRSPLTVLLDEGIREDYFRRHRATQKVSCLLGAADYHGRVTVKVYLHVRKFYRVEFKIARF